MWIALYVNCIHGKFEPAGPFITQAGAVAYCNRRNRELGERLWEPLELTDPSA